MHTPSFPRRAGLVLASVAVASAVAGGATAHAAPASPAPGPVDIRIDDDYWACLALDYVDIGTCIENPLPDLSQYPTLPDLLDALLGGLGV